MEGDRISVIYRTPQQLHRLNLQDWEMLRNTGFPVNEIWGAGLLMEDEEEDELECPQETNYGL